MLTRCPSCQASVLDDDAEQCPFCGSPMDPAKAEGFQPAAKPAEKKPVASRPKSSSSATKEKPAAVKTSAKPAARQSAAAGSKTRSSKASDDPFAVDPSTMSGVIPLSTKRTPKRPRKIVCPMCDTVGYAPVAASGKDVRCANPKCMVPVFTAPDFAAPKKEIVEEPTSKGAVLTIVGVAIVVLGGGFAYWWLNFRAPEPRSTDPNIAAPATPTTPDAPVEEEPAGPEESEVVAEPTASPAEVRAAAFERWPRAIETIADIQRRPARLRHAAESYAIAGNVEQAQGHLAKIGADDPFYKIGPLAEIAWAQLEAGDEAGAKATFGELAPLRDVIPGQGFEPARAAILWSAAAARFGDAAAAREMANSRRDDPAGERLLATLESAAAVADFGLYANHQWRPVLPWNAPKSVAVTMNLLRHDQADTARSWGEGAANTRTQAEILAAWAEGQVASGSGGAETVRQAVASLDPAVKLYVLSRAALRAMAGQDTATAETLLSEIEATAGGIAAAEPLAATTAGELYNINLSDAAGEQLRAAAFAEAAHVAAGLERLEQAETLLWRAVDHSRAAAPPVADVAAREQELQSSGEAGIREALKVDLGLADAAAQEAVSDYLRRLPDYRAAAEAALAAQAEILARGIGWGLGEPILAEIQGRDGQGRTYLTGPAGGRLFAAFERAGYSEGVAATRGAGVTDGDVPQESGIELVVWPLIENGNFTEAGAELVARRWNRISEETRLGLGLRIVSRLASEGNHASIPEFLRPISSDTDREEMYRAWGARAGAIEDGMVFLEQIGQSRLSITALASALRGLTAGLEVAPAGSGEEGVSGEGGEEEQEG